MKDTVLPGPVHRTYTCVSPGCPGIHRAFSPSDPCRKEVSFISTSPSHACTKTPDPHFHADQVSIFISFPDQSVDPSRSLPSHPDAQAPQPNTRTQGASFRYGAHISSPSPFGSPERINRLQYPSISSESSSSCSVKGRQARCSVPKVYQSSLEWKAPASSPGRSRAK